MAAKIEKTRYPGISKRTSERGEVSYIFRYRLPNGKRPAETCHTLEAALQAKRAREAARDRGELDLVTQVRTPFGEFAAEWIERYNGNGKRGFSEDTRAEYRRDLDRYGSWLGNRRLGAITSRDISEWIRWLCDPNEHSKELADETVRRIVAPVRACFATARREGLIRSNPCDDVPLPVRPKIEEEDTEKVKALTRDELRLLLSIVPNKWRLFFEFLTATGLRWGEATALRWRDVTLEGSDPQLHVRRSRARPKKGQPPAYKAPKSKYGKRMVPLDPALADALKDRHKESEFDGPDDLVFPNGEGLPLDHTNTLRRVLRPCAQEAGVSWVTFHSFRHSCASLLFSADRNVKQVQRFLGHHSPAFTLDRYVHLMDEGVGEGLSLAAELRPRTSPVRPYPLDTVGISPEPIALESASQSGFSDLSVLSGTLERDS